MHYVLDENNNKVESLSKEEVIALIAKAIQEGQLPSVDEDTAFVTKLKSAVDGKTYKVGFCTQAQYNELEANGSIESNTYYFITDDDTETDLEDSIKKIIDGTTEVGMAARTYSANYAAESAYSKNADYADEAGSAEETDFTYGSETKEDITFSGGLYKGAAFEIGVNYKITIKPRADGVDGYYDVYNLPIVNFSETSEHAESVFMAGSGTALRLIRFRVYQDGRIFYNSYAVGSSGFIETVVNATCTLFIKRIR